MEKEGKARKYLFDGETLSFEGAGGEKDLGGRSAMRGRVEISIWTANFR
jgi:hypothetical protein